MSDTQRLPNLYQLLGLSGLENKSEKISAALKRAQAKAEALKSESRNTDAARLQKVVALGQKYLLSPALKSIYDAQWESIYGSATAPTKTQTPTPTPTPSPTPTPTIKAVAKPVAQPVVTAVAATATSATSTSDNEMSWDMSSLAALLPAADPHAPFQMAEYLRTSQVRDPLAAEADLRKLISLLGGELEPTAETTSAHTISLHELSGDNGFNQHESLSTDGGLSMPRSTNTAAAAALAKRMHQKRQRAMLIGGSLLVAAVGGLGLFSLYLNQPATKPNQPLAQVPPAPRLAVPSEPQEPANENQSENKPAIAPSPTALIQPGPNVKPLEIQATPLPQPPTPDKAAMEPMEPMKPASSPEPTQPDATRPEPAPQPAKPEPEPAKPEPAKPEPAKPEPAKPEPAKPEPAKPEPAKPEPAKPEPAKPEPAKPEPAKPAEPPAAAVKLTDKEKKVWQEDMKRVRAGLSKLDPAASEQQLESMKPLAKTAAQQSQLTTLLQAAGLIRKAREALVAGIGGLESAQTFKVGSSTEVTFVEGDETRIIVKFNGRRQEYKLETIPPAMALEMMKMQPNVVDTNLEAAMGAYIMVQTKKNATSTATGKKLLEDAAGLGTISKELAQFYAADYKL